MEDSPENHVGSDIYFRQGYLPDNEAFVDIWWNGVVLEEDWLKVKLKQFDRIATKHNWESSPTLRPGELHLTMSFGYEPGAQAIVKLFRELSIPLSCAKQWPEIFMPMPDVEPSYEEDED